jgi:hypothetical protein
MVINPIIWLASGRETDVKNFYIQSMRKIFMLALCMCAMGFAQPGWENPKCYEVDGIMHDLYRKWKTENNSDYLAAAGSLFGGLMTECECVGKTVCAEVGLCTSFKCPGEEETVSIFGDIQNFVAKVGSRGSNSGNAGQPASAK